MMGGGLDYCVRGYVVEMFMEDGRKSCGQRHEVAVWAWVSALLVCSL